MKNSEVIQTGVYKYQEILIVDDFPSNIQILAQAFQDDYDIKIATNGTKALEIISISKPDLILLDVVMPEMDGYDVCRYLKNNDHTKDIPIIFITAQKGIEYEAWGLELGAVDYIYKPFHLPLVRARVRNHLQLKRKSDLLENLALLDALTEIPNRRRFDECLLREWHNCMRNVAPFSMLMMDIDKFKSYNDNYGHGNGDQCLRQVAQCLQSCIKRTSDTITRYGGEEFAAILPETHIEGALLLGERCRAQVEEISIPHKYSEINQCVTISVGCATFVPRADSKPDMLVKSADQMLYLAKAEGRNRVKGIDLKHNIATES
jgi:diguanylate cyclase (GGDEF)-like protein